MTPGFLPTYPAGAVDQETWNRLATINPSVVSDILNARGVYGHVMRADIQALDPRMRICGIARTMSDASAQGHARAGREYELLFAAIDGVANGEVLVTDRGDCCVRGELCAEAAMRRGGNGIVINGFTRGSADFRETGKGR